MIYLMKLAIWLLFACASNADKLFWSDEFNDEKGTKPSEENWYHDLGDGTRYGIAGWGNGELQYYTDSPKNSATDGQGNLVISALTSNSSYDCYYGKCRYTSARLVSKLSLKYGRFEIRMKVPSGKGIWPAFWMLGENINEVGWPFCGGIDIMQMRGSEPNKLIGGLQGFGYSGSSALIVNYTTNDNYFDEDFHVFAVQWEPKRIQWQVDDHVFASKTLKDIPSGGQWHFNKPFKMRINLAIGGSFDGYPVTNETFPKNMYIDYVRVYDISQNDVE